MGIDRSDGRAGRRHAGIANARENELLQAVFGQLTSLRNRRRNMRKRLIHNSAERHDGVPVRFQLVIGPDRFKPLNKIGRSHDIDTKAADQIDRSRIDPRHIGDGIEGGVLHGDLPTASQERGEECPLLFPSEIWVRRTRQFVQDVRFDSVHQFDRLSRGRNPIVPTPRDMPRRIEQQHPIGQGIAAPKIIEQPAIESGCLSERRLDLRNPRVMSQGVHCTRILSSGEGSVNQTGSPS